MRLGIFGGTFDPPHVGHLIAAVEAFEALSLDRLVFVPAGRQPLKAEREAAPGPSRLEMVRLLVADDDRFDVDPIEIEKEGLSYTVDTLAAFADRYPDAERFFVTGADIVKTFDRWREPERVSSLARLAILERRGGDGGSGAGSGDEQASRAALQRGGAVFLRTRRIDVSSTEVRARVRAGKPVRGFVPDAIAAYIDQAGLYR